nr:ATP-binding cassette domain-containing protein [uncultured Ruegeria sp.]
MSAQLLLEGVSVSLSDQERRFTLEVPGLSLTSGEAIGLTGPSGTGKTLLLETLGLLRRPTTAKKFLIGVGEDGLDFGGIWSNPSMSPAEIRGTMFGFVPQSGGLLPFLTVADNVALSQKIVGMDDPGWRSELLQRLGISEISALYPGALSIGQRQRVAICRALAHRPAFVIADEPTAALDPGAASTAMGLLIDMAISGGAGVIISSHDLDLLDQFSLRRIALGLVDPANQSNVISQLHGQTGVATAGDAA